MKQWRQYRLIDILDKIIDYRGKTPQKTDSGIPLITAKIIKDGRILPPNEFIAESNYDQWMVRGIPHEGDVVLTVEAPLGEVAQLGNEKIALAQRVVTLRGKEGVLDNTFLKYFLMSQVGQARLKARETGTTVTGIKQSELREILIDCPEYDKQVQIASILRSIDDKIELNRQINDNLEQQARELFKSWFINSPQESWKEKSLSDYFNVITGKKDANYSTPEGAYPFFTCSQDILKAPSYSFDGHAILVAGNGDFNVKRYIGKFEAYQRTYVLIPHEEKFHAFLYLMIDYYLPEITGGSRGSVIKFITKGNIANFRFRVPQNNIDDQLKKLNDIYKIIDCNLEESSRLTKMRDTLLPKLMSGELKINEIDC